MANSAKQVALKVHRWAGLSIGLVLLVLAFTGAGMAFRPQIEPLVTSDLLSVPHCEGTASIDAMTATAVNAYPQSTVDFIRIERAEPGAARIPTPWIRFLDKQTFYFHPCTGALLGQNNRYSGFFGTLENIHRARFIENGNKVNGAFVLAFLPLIALLGLYMWWPKRLTDTKKALTLHPKLKGPARRVNRHRVIGALVAPIVIASALTGLPQAFGWYKDGVYQIAGSSAKEVVPVSKVPGDAKRLSMNALLAKAFKLNPDPAQVQLRYPVKADDAIEGFFIARGAAHPNARGMFYLDAYSGNALTYTPYAKASAGHRLYFSMLSWHHGETFGFFTQFLVFLGAAGLLVLGWTGIGNYLRRVWARRAKPRPDSVAPVAG